MTEESRNTGLGKVESLLSTDAEEHYIESLASHLGELHISQIAELMQRLPRPQRLSLWRHIGPGRRCHALLELNDAVRDFIVANTNAESLAESARSLESDDLAELVRLLPAKMAESVVALLDRPRQQKISRVLTYSTDQAGSQMNPDTLLVSPAESIRSVINSLRRHPDLTRASDVLFVVDKDHRLVGDVLIKDLLLHSSKLPVSEIMDSPAPSIRASDLVEEAVRIIRDRDLIALAVVNDENVLLGQITVDDVVEVVDDKRADAAVHSVSALTRDEDLFAPVWQSTSKRALWLGINLITAFLAAAVVGQFGATIEQAVGLAVLMPIVASMGGIAGSQTMVLVIRGIALNLVNGENVPRLAYKEMAVGIANGAIWAAIIAILVYFWMGEWWLTTIILMALFINILVGSFSGVVLPLLLRWLGADPAISASVILTTITDVVGLGVFLGAASLYLG